MTDAKPSGQFVRDERDHFIPVRKSDIINALIRDGRIRDADRQDKFRQLCRLLGSIFHYEYFDRLETLRDDYYHFNPEVLPNARVNSEELEHARVELIGALEDVLKGANYVEIPETEIGQAHEERRILRVKVMASTQDYHKVRFFRRGHHKEQVDIRKWFGVRTNKVDTWVFDNVLLVVTVKFPKEVPPKQLKRLQLSGVRPGSILIKYFRNIAPSDLPMLLPKVRVVMNLFDKLTIAVPAIVGGIPLLINLLPTLTVLVLVVGFYLGVSGAVAHDDVLKAFAAVSGIAALGGLIMRQRLKYERLSLKYQKEISDHFYFRNVSNNAGIFDCIVGAAEEQECKEAFLAYYFLATAPETPSQEELDAAIEHWLAETFGVDIDFEVDDALAKLERLALLKRDSGRLSVPSLDEALILLDRAWDNFFLFANEADARREESKEREQPHDADGHRPAIIDGGAISSPTTAAS